MMMRHFQALLQLAERFNTRWLIANYEAGDMMIHRAYMIHPATTNPNPHSRMRLSPLTSAFFY